jgi:hypothetical protein
VISQGKLVLIWGGWTYYFLIFLIVLLRACIFFDPKLHPFKGDFVPRSHGIEMAASAQGHFELYRRHFVFVFVLVLLWTSWIILGGYRSGKRHLMKRQIQCVAGLLAYFVMVLAFVWIRAHIQFDPMGFNDREADRVPKKEIIRMAWVVTTYFQVYAWLTGIGVAFWLFVAIWATKSRHRSAQRVEVSS